MSDYGGPGKTQPGGFNSQSVRPLLFLLSGRGDVSRHNTARYAGHETTVRSSQQHMRSPPLTLSSVRPRGLLDENHKQKKESSLSEGSG